MTDDNVTNFPKSRDLIAEMKGADLSGNAVVIHGVEIPGVVMYDNGDEIAFVIDHRLEVSFPRAHAWNAAALMLGAMAFGAGCDPLNYEPRPFAKKVVSLGEGPPKT